MTWKSHRLITGLSVLLVTENPWLAVVSSFGSTFPDRVELWMPGKWQKHHRFFSHWFVLYLILIFVVNLPVWGGDPLGVHRFFQWFFVGCLAHIIQDAICGKIPVLSPFSRRYICPRLFYTGGPGENRFVLFYVISALTVWVFMKFPLNIVN